MFPRRLTNPPLMVGATVGDAAEHVAPREVQALGLGPLPVRNDTKGKGKGKFDSRKMGCMYFNQGKGSCLKADRCTFSHDPSIPVYVRP